MIIHSGLSPFLHSSSAGSKNSGCYHFLLNREFPQQGASFAKFCMSLTEAVGCAASVMDNFLPKVIVENTKTDHIDPDSAFKSHHTLPTCRLITATLKKS
jgi:hypothetical protein